MDVSKTKKSISLPKKNAEYVMNTVKEEALRAIAELPDTATMNDIMYHLYVMDAVLQGKAAAQQGKTLSSEELLREIEQR